MPYNLSKKKLVLPIYDVLVVVVVVMLHMYQADLDREMLLQVGLLLGRYDQISNRLMSLKT